MRLTAVIILLFSTKLLSQVADFDQEHIESSLINFSKIDVSTEYYRFSELSEALYLVANGTIELNDISRLNIELSGTSYWNGGQLSFTAGDFNLAYSKNFYSNNLFDPGYQGLTASLKGIFPTGDSENPGLFGHFILEPSIFYSWLLKNEKFFISNQWRFFLPLIDANHNDDPPLFLRFEPKFGYESKKIWASITMDNRMVFNRDEYVLHGRLDFGLKLTDKFGITSFYTHRLVGNVLFERYAGLGIYNIF